MKQRLEEASEEVSGAHTTPAELWANPAAPRGAFGHSPPWVTSSALAGVPSLLRGLPNTYYTT